MSENYMPQVGDEVRGDLVVRGHVRQVYAGSGFVDVECPTSDGDTVVWALPLAETVWTRVVPPEPEWQQGDVVLTARGRVAVRRDGGDWMLLSSDGDQVGVVADVVLTRPLTLLARDGQPWTYTIIGQVRVECRTSDGDTVYRVLPLAETVWTRVSSPEPEWQQGDVVLTAAGALTAAGRVAVRRADDWMLLSADGDQIGAVADVVLTRPLTLLARDGQPWTYGDAEPAAAEGPQWRPGHVVDAACDCRFVRGHDMWRCHISWPHCDLDHSVGDVYHTEDLPAPLTVVSTPVDRNGGAV